MDRPNQPPLHQEKTHGRQVRAQKTAAGQFHFTLLGTNGRVIATSESYKTKAAALNGIESIKQNAPAAATDDQTS